MISARSTDFYLRVHVGFQIDCVKFVIKNLAKTLSEIHKRGYIYRDVKVQKLTVVLNYYEGMETYSRIGLLRRYGNLQSYWTTTKLWKLTVVLDYYEAMETYSRIGILRSYGNLQSFWNTAKL